MSGFDSLIVNLLKPLSNSAVQVVVVVSSKCKLEQIEGHAAEVKELGGQTKIQGLRKRF